MNVEQEFDEINKNVGSKIFVKIKSLEKEIVEEGLLKKLNPFTSIVIIKPISIWNYNLPFVGPGEGISEIKTSDGKIIYLNEFLKYEKINYSFCNKEDVDYINMLRTKKFGQGHEREMIE